MRGLSGRGNREGKAGSLARAGTVVTMNSVPTPGLIAA